MRIPFLITSIIIISFFNLIGQDIDSLKSYDTQGNLTSIQFMQDGLNSNYILNYEYDSLNRIIKEYATDTLNRILPRIGLSEIIIYKYEEINNETTTKTTIHYDKDMNPTINDQYWFHKVKTTYNSDQQKIEDWFFKESGETFQRIGYKYNDNNLLEEVRYLNESGELKSNDIAIVKLEYDEYGRKTKESNFKSDLKPYHKGAIPFITETRYIGNIECKKLYDDELNLIKRNKLASCEKLPYITIPDQNGNPIQVNEENGKLKIIHFWGPWSRVCSYMNERLVKLYQNSDANEIEIISIALEKVDNKSRWISSIQEQNLAWEKHSCDFQYWDSEAVKIFGVTSLPRYYVIDEGGILIGNDLKSIQEVEDVLEKKGKL